jgi:undecaprenyl-diphosphatase
MTIPQALVIGIAQLAALIPGASRSASSIVGGLLVGLDRPTATAFSFYLAIPTLGGATVYALIKNREALTAGGEAFALLVGIVVAFVTALIAVAWLLRYVAHHDFRWFALYRVVMGVIVLIVFAR